MKFKILSIAVTTLGAALTFSVAAETAPRAGSGSGVENTPGSDGLSDSQRGQMDISADELKKLDKNQDGKVSKDEAKADLTWRTRFDKLDANGDGMVDASEVVALSESAPAAGKGRTSGGKDDLPTPSY